MKKTAVSVIVTAILSGCTTHPSVVDSSVNKMTPDQFQPASRPDPLADAYERRVRQRADELYRTRQAGSLSEADKKARAELGDKYPPPTEPDSVYAERQAKKKAKPALDQKALDAAAQELSRQRSQ